jgi:hypothetical protein
MNEGFGGWDNGDNDIPGVHVVAARKLIVLNVATLGLYQIYWFYQHWRQYRAHVDHRIWPVARAIFAIFYVSSLFKWLDALARERGRAPSWRPTTHAAMWIVLIIAERITNRLDPHGKSAVVLAVEIALGFLATIPLVVAQRVANGAAGDEHGRNNSKLTLANWIVVALGACVTALAALSFTDLGSAEPSADDEADVYE